MRCAVLAAVVAVLAVPASASASECSEMHECTGTITEATLRHGVVRVTGMLECGKFVSCDPLLVLRPRWGEYRCNTEELEAGEEESPPFYRWPVRIWNPPAQAAPSTMSFSVKHVVPRRVRRTPKIVACLELQGEGTIPNQECAGVLNPELCAKESVYYEEAVTWTSVRRRR